MKKGSEIYIKGGIAHSILYQFIITKLSNISNTIHSYISLPSLTSLSTHSYIYSTMKFTLATTTFLVASTYAGPLAALVSRDSPFTDATCKLSQALTPGTPLIALFPAASHLGNIVGPVLKSAIGVDRLEEIDALADQLCV
jgi:hypothetical protein